ncbi:hypothetical protein B2G71_21985 [Novosphingobium sp. PC22D]|uniref:oligosaccharide flippase family protein n=1 Tax=Novosphingobium sp. PC22D TaxID=1962403 RepID=UPI000BF05D96|nr:oligosaccharide flippase family protein [Novosphingobium sp. PC22D]PEQ10499.1 hypothetical protein B2G71_21985 [Novosphingobium sp. PC22D]
MQLANVIERVLPASARPVVSGLAAYGAAEIGTRVLRILAIVVIARQIAPAEIGVAALAISLFEIVRVLANSGIGQRIIAAADDELDSVCNAARLLFTLWCAGVAAVQLLVACMLWLVFAKQDVAAMLAVLSVVYFVMPPGLVQVFLLMRDGRLGATARIAATQTAADHLLSLMLALIWPSAWALVLPRLLTAPIWLVLVRRARTWNRAEGVAPAPARSFFRFGAGVLVTELTTAGRQQFDKLIVGALLGTEALGYYFFAFNAGLGIANSFVGALAIVLFPHFCKTKDEADRATRLKHALVLALGVFGPIVIAQILLAPVYVPLLFGEQWAPMAPLVSILCLAALPMIVASVTTAWLRATNRAERDAVIAGVGSAAALAGLAVGCLSGLEAAAWSYVGALWLVLLPATGLVIAHGLRAQRKPSFPKEYFA